MARRRRDGGHLPGPLRYLIVGLILCAVLVVVQQRVGDRTEAGREPLTDGTAIAAAQELPVTRPGSGAGYSREEFGSAWADVDHNGCDTRNDILARDLTDLARAPDECVVLSGTLRDPYTSTTISFTRGAATSAAVQIDHVVALQNAWQSGAANWTAKERLQFANDPLNLLAVDGPTNQAKGAADASTWLPPDESYRCQYVARQVAVKRLYGLSVTPDEHDALIRVLKTCPAQQLP